MSNNLLNLLKLFACYAFVTQKNLVKHYLTGLSTILQFFLYNPNNETSITPITIANAIVMLK